jgi:hypothetical protein
MVTYISFRMIALDIIVIASFPVVEPGVTSLTTGFRTMKLNG